MSPRIRTLARLVGLWVALQLGACATVPGPRDARDPWEGYNRAVYEFNDTVDRNVAKPLAQGYKAVTPDFVDKGITNFLSNLGDVRTAVYNLLQLKFKSALQDAGRVAFNSTIGLLGFIDVASHLNLPKHDEDFGQVLGYWGVPSGPYLVLPLLGPSTVRDAPALYVDYELSPRSFLFNYPESYVLTGVDLLDTRADLLDLEELAEDLTYDRYVTLRNVYLQRREFQVYDGQPPQEEDELLKELRLLDEGL